MPTKENRLKKPLAVILYCSVLNFSLCITVLVYLPNGECCICNIDYNLGIVNPPSIINTCPVE